MMEPTTDAMVNAAQDAYDVAAAEAARFEVRYLEAMEAARISGVLNPEVLDAVVNAAAKLAVARAARGYALSVLHEQRISRAVPA